MAKKNSSPKGVETRDKKGLFILLAVALTALLAGAYVMNGYFSSLSPEEKEVPSIASYEDCIRAGYPSIDTYPEQCATPEGSRFTRVPAADELHPDAAAHIASKADLIVVTEPAPLAVVSSPLVIKGEARGTWYFEANFPVRLLDGNGKTIAVWYASAVLDPNDPESTWMTEDFVPFEAELTFVAPTTKTGTLILGKSNPSDLREHDDELRIPVRFDVYEGSMRTIRLHYYNEANDLDASGNVMCSADGLVAVERSIPVTQTPIQDAVRLLMRGELKPEEISQGLTTEYPLPGLELRGASLENAVLTLIFADPEFATSGGACRAGILWAQIEATVLQFEGIEEVRFEPEDLFQP